MKLPILLKSLRQEEHKEFEKFLQSPFFKESDQYLKYFRFLCKHHPGFELGKPELQAAYLRCFGKQSLNDTKLYNLMSGMGKQLEQFLVVSAALSQDTHDGPALFDQLLVKALGDRNMDGYFRAGAQQLINKIAMKPVREMDDPLAIQQLHHDVYYNPDTPKPFGYTAHFQLAMDHLDQYYCMAKLRYAAEAKTLGRIIQVEFELPLLEAVIGHSAQPGKADSHPLWDIYRQLVDFYLQDVTESGFRQLIAAFTGYFDLLPKRDQTLLLRHLINSGIALNARSGTVVFELLGLYKMAIKANAMLDGNRITHNSFINIANIASQCRDFQWAEEFITEFSQYLEENKRKPVTELARAGLYYNQGMLDAAHTCLTPEVFTVPSFDILARNLLAKITFDRYILHGQDYDFLIAHLKAYEKYVSNRPWPPEKTKSELNFIRFVRKMAALKFELVDISPSTRLSLQKSLHQLKAVVVRKWLEEKIGML